ncbi:Uncharacterised protein [Klebsiella michiganensis]|nr:Uncharacterised protein [Klebsiella michiganensis]
MLAPLNLSQVSARRRMLTAGQSLAFPTGGDNARRYQH